MNVTSVYHSLDAVVSSRMRHALWVSLLLAGKAGSKAPPALSRDMLAAHNAVRARVGAPTLIWSDRLAAHSQNWADTLLARKRLVHRSEPIYGENLFEMRGASASPAQVVAAWASESRNYDYNSNRCRGVCGHYTQIVWRDTKEVGWGVARGGGREVWVCNYDPPGNWAGKRPY